MTVKLEDVGLVFVDISDEDGIAVIEVSEQGPAGPPGATGPAGPAGATGPQGPIGATGVQGSTGSPGPSGPQGADSTVPGEMGATGSTGPDGITGSTGVRGSRWFVGASSPTIGNLEGDLYYDEINDVLYVYTAGNYEYYTNLKGADGVDGATGPFGDTGATGPISMVPGPTGPQGFTGATGNTGATGPSGVFSPQADQTITGNISGGAAIPTGLTPGQVRSTIGLGTAALAASTDFDLSGSASAAQAAAIAAAATDATAKANAKVADAINDGTTTVAPSQNAVFDALALKADLASPALTGNPTAPTQAVGNSSTRIATTAFVQGARLPAAPYYGTGADGDVTFSSNTTITSDLENGLKNYRNVTVASGVTLTVVGLVLFSGTLTNNGTISARGNDGVLNGQGLRSGGLFPATVISNAGANGSNNAVGTGGSPVANPTSSQAVMGGGRGGTGGTAAAGSVAGGAAGLLVTLNSLTEAAWRNHFWSIVSGVAMTRGSSPLHVCGGGGFIALVTEDSAHSFTFNVAGGTGGTGLGTGATGIAGSAGNTYIALGA